ncbi:MAG: hypothetical protein JJT94_11200 [Bernardetiaceae bacterium]|nr:hypothetical protein [Bernardetiaceae bacterium]
MQFFNIQKTPNELLISRRWSGSRYKGLFFSLNASIAFWALMFFLVPAENRGSNSNFWLGMTPFFAVSIGLGYHWLCGLLNTTYVHVTREQISIYFKPLPWIATKSINAKLIEQLFIKSYDYQIRRNGKLIPNNYRLHALLRDGQQVKLFVAEELDSLDSFREIELMIEDFYHIEDKAVIGEAFNRRSASILQAEAKEKPRIQKNKDFSTLNVYDLHHNYIYSKGIYTWKVIREVQYDWQHAESHRQIQATNQKEVETFYIIKKGWELRIFEEHDKILTRTLPDVERQLSQDLPPSSITYENQTYWREHALRGSKFLVSDKNTQPANVKVWIYFNQDRNEMLRIENLDNFDFRLTYGKAVEAEAFYNLLPSGES